MQESTQAQGKEMSLLYENFQIFYKVLVLESFNCYSHCTVLVKLYRNHILKEPVAKGAGSNGFSI